MVTLSDIVALANSISEDVSAQFNGVGIKKIEFVDPNIFRYTLNDLSSTVVDVPVASFNNFTNKEKAIVNKLLGLYSANKKDTYLGGDLQLYPVQGFNQTNDNKSFTILSSNFTKVSDDEYYIDVIHGLNDLNCIPTIVNNNNEGCTEGWKYEDANTIRITSTSPFQGRCVVNYSSSNGQRLDNISCVKSSYIFESNIERDDYFSANMNFLQNGLVIIVNDGTTKTLYTWEGIDSPQGLYLPISWSDSTALIKGEKGIGLKPKHKFDNNKLYFENQDGSYDEGLELYSNIDVSKFTEFLKDFKGSSLQDLCSYLDTHKEFLNGLFIGDEKVEGSFKIVTNNSKLEYQRLENGIYKTIGTIGSYTTDVINLDSAYSTVNFKTPTRDLNLARITTDGNSVQVGDVRLDRLILSGKELYSQRIENTNTSHNYIVNNDTSITQPITDWEFTINIPSQNNYSYYALYAVDTDNTTTGYYKYTIIDVLTGNLVYYSGSDFELKQGLTYKFTTTGLHTETLPKLVHLTCGRQYKITFTAQSSIGFKGGLVGGQFKPYCVLKYYFAEEDKLLSKGDVTDSVSSNSSKTIASSKAVYTLSQAINSISGGMSPIIPISVSDFSALKSGTNGTHFILTEDGAILGETVHKYDNIFIVNTFGNTVETERPILSSDYVLISANSNTKGNIFITNVEPTNSSKSVIKTMNTYPDNGSILSVMSDDNSYKITVEWDRGEEYCGLPNLNGKDITGITNKVGSTYTGYVILNSTDINANKIVATLNLNTYTIAFSIVSPPSISSITFGSLPNSQTELKEGDSVNVTIVTNKPIDTVEFQDIGAFQHQTISATSNTTVIVSGIIANRGITLQNLKASIRVKSTEGSWSGITESIDTLPLNNIKPTITLISKTFSNGFSALKNSETCVVQVSSTDCDTLTSSAIGTELNVEAMVGNDCTVTRLNEDYNDLIANLKIEGTRANNGATNYLDVCVEIANVPPTLTNTSSVTKIRTSESKSVLCSFDQKVKIESCAIASPNKGALVTGTLPTSSYDTSYSPNISVLDADNHSNNNLTMTLTVTNMSGLSAVVEKYYVICGFIQKQITVNYPAITTTIPIIINSNSLIISGVINSSQPYNIVTNYINPPMSISDYSINGNTLNLPPLGVLGSFYYNASNPIIITIEETV